MNRLAKALKLPAREKLLVAEAFFALAGMRAAVLILPFSWVRKSVAAIGYRERSSSNPRLRDPGQVVWSVAAASRLVPGGKNCLARALAAKLMLARLGYPIDLKIGTRKNEHGRLEAHAWLESEGRIVFGEFELGQYATMSGNPGIHI